MKKSIPTEQTPDNIGRVLALLATTPAALDTLSRGLSEEALRRPLGPGERSFAEDVAHLINTESRSNEAIIMALALNEPLLAPLHAERHYGAVMRYTDMPVADSLAYFGYRRAALLRVLQNLSEKQWGRAIREEGKQRRESVYWRARGMALHEAEHIADLTLKLSTQGNE